MRKLPELDRPGQSLLCQWDDTTWPASRFVWNAKRALRESDEWRIRSALMSAQVKQVRSVSESFRAFPCKLLMPAEVESLSVKEARMRDFQITLLRACLLAGVTSWLSFIPLSMGSVRLSRSLAIRMPFSSVGFGPSREAQQAHPTCW